ncbi:MAG: Coenzyme F420 hydrogenase/dehydrogenase, beta subunit C-terminal domain [Lachnospiraceae bacterium]|nr:Coenzyme F420 hydrogenase/dehydrogenase, beta subunit C-terminal domain [Lachnospiraceae bacterium]
MKTVYSEKKYCSGCGACSYSCKLNAIQMKPDEEGFLYPIINPELCVQCGKCRKVCPFIKENTKNGIPKVYAAKNASDAERKSSSSGGIFTLLSDAVLESGGVVYGALFDSKMQVIHKCASSKEERNSLRGSKYIQSNLKHIFLQVQQDALEGKKILFTGTPCQIAGLKSFLGKEYSNLYLCDIVCHGVSSPQIFKDYIFYIEKKYQSKIEEISFRDKEQGWTHQKWKIKLQSGQILLDNTDLRIYKNLYYGHVIQRPSCHVCPYADIHRQGDITLGDFWGIENSLPDFKDELGINVVLVNTHKGTELFENESIKERLIYVKSDVKSCLQPQLQYPTEKSKKRERFWQDYQKSGFYFVAKKYGTLNMIGIFKQKIKRVLSKMKHSWK